MQKNLFSEDAPAKINLALHVRERLPNGYHALETIFAFAAYGDKVSVQVDNSEGLSLSIKGPFAEQLSHDCDNLILQAARLLLQNCGSGQAGANLTLEKNLPVASGLGGGSADAAATLRLLNRYWRCGLELSDLARLGAQLGADVPVCIYSAAMLGQGTGTHLEPCDLGEIAGMPAILINPGVAVPTGPVFGAWDRQDHGPLLWGHDVMASLLQARNDLEKPAIAQYPQIGEVLEQLEQTGPIIARMSGSGASCFALYNSKNERDIAQQSLQKSAPDMWICATRIKGPDDI